MFIPFVSTQLLILQENLIKKYKDEEFCSSIIGLPTNVIILLKNFPWLLTIISTNSSVKTNLLDIV